MSRASDLRDAVASSIQSALPTQRVETCVIANYAPEELDDPVIAVRLAKRTITVSMGPASRLVDIEVVFMARNPSNSGYPASDEAKESYRTIEVAAADSSDDILETVIDLWTPATALSQNPLAGHRLTELTQEVSVDVPTYYENGLFFTILTIQFYDMADE